MTGGVAVIVSTPADVPRVTSLLGSGPLVVEVLGTAGEPGTPAVLALADLLRGHDDVTVASYDWYALRTALSLGLRTAFTTPAGIALGAALYYVREAGHAACHPHVDAVLESPEAVAQAREAGVAVVCWDVREELLPRLWEIGVDGAIYTTTDSASGTLRNVTFSTSPR